MHGIYATFMAKPMEDEPGSAMHIHQSIVDADTGANLFATDGDDLYAISVSKGWTDSDDVTLQDLGRPLVFYQLQNAPAPLKMTRSGTDIALTW